MISPCLQAPLVELFEDSFVMSWGDFEQRWGASLKLTMKTRVSSASSTFFEFTGTEQ